MQRSSKINSSGSESAFVEESDSETPRKIPRNSVGGDETNRVIMALRDAENQRTIIEKGRDEMDGKRVNLETRRFEFEK